MKYINKLLCLSFTVFFLLFFLSLKGVANNSQAHFDSLLLVTEEKEGEEKINTLIELAEQQSEDFPEKSLEILDKALSEAEKEKNKVLEAKAIYHKGLVFNKQMQDSEALNFYFQALSLIPDAQEKDFQAQIYNSIGLTYFYLDQYDSSIFYINKVLNITQDKHSYAEEGHAYFTLGNIAKKNNQLDTSLNNFKQAAIAYKKADDLNGLSKVYNSTGIIYFNTQLYDSALHYYRQYFEIKQKEDDQRGAAIALTNIGNVYQRIGNYSEAIVNYNKALAYFEKINFLEGIATCYNNIATIYENLVVGDFYEDNLNTYQQALAYHEMALETRKKQDNQLQIAYSLNNMGTIFFKIEETELRMQYGRNFADSILNKRDKKNYFQKALEYYQQAYDIQNKIEYKLGMAGSLSNIGRIYTTIGEYEKALEIYNESVAISREINNRYELSLGYFQLGMNYDKLGEKEKALDFLNKALRIAYEIDSKELKKSCYENISEIKEDMHLYQAALSNYKRFKGISDSLFNEENSRIINEIKTQYETEKKEQINRQLQLENNLAHEQNRTQRIVIIAFIFVLIIIAGFMVLVFRQNQQIKKKNHLLEEKNELISEQKREITDSIEYASLIQRAILPPDELLQSLLQPEYFILYRPRDIVSGDFYWATEHNNRILIMAADCTGHGVPGAFMSMLGIAFLNEIVNQTTKQLGADEILNELRTQIITALHQTGEQGSNQDGMDVALCIIDKEKRELEFAGANNPLILIRNDELLQYKPDKMPIGIYLTSDVPFSSHKISIEEGDCLYFFSDGYQDQFGGENGKKFMIKNMKNMFMENHKKPMTEQKEIMEKTIIDWMGDEHEAVDDIVVIGIRV